MTPAQLSICTGASLMKATGWLSEVQAAMNAYAINTPLRQAAFLAQIGHESGGLQWVSELWGPTAAQARYEGRADLGNVKPGDGSRFRGHGLIQTTGRANHAALRDRLRARFPEAPDFEAQPTELTLPQWAALSAADFWDMKGLNALADVGDFIGITKKINGGMNGYNKRRELYDAGLAALGVA